MTIVGHAKLLIFFKMYDGFQSDKVIESVAEFFLNDHSVHFVVVVIFCICIFSCSVEYVPVGAQV